MDRRRRCRRKLAGMADVPDIAIAAVRRYCDDKIPAALRNELRVEHAVRGKSITIHECRPPWDGTAEDEWTRQPVAQLRYDPAGHQWQLYWADRKSRWHRYERAAATTQLGALLDEIDRDPTGIVWG